MNEDRLSPPGHALQQRMQLRYGFNEIYGWWHLSAGPHREEVQRRLRLMNTAVVRVFVFDQPVPDPVKNWSAFAGHLQSILDIGARPMVTFAKFRPPYDNPAGIRDFVSRSTDVVWGCLEQWGGDVVRDWYWGIWNEPNNLIIGGDLTFAQYRNIYEAVTVPIYELLEPHLAGLKARIGGPAIDGTHRAYWLDWIARLIHEVDDRLVGFASWHRYGDWRPAVSSESLALEMWGSPDSPNGPLFEELLMAQTPTYEARARGVARILKGRDIENVCGELNTISHHEHYYTLGMNQNVLGAAYYASALIHLLRGGADLELRWTATAHTDAYGLITKEGRPMPAGLAKQLFAQHVRYGDFVHFPAHRLDRPSVDCVVSSDSEGRLSGVFVNTSSQRTTLRPNDWDERLQAATTVLWLDAGTGDAVRAARFEGTVTLDGYGLAVVTNAIDTVVD